MRRVMTTPFVGLALLTLWWTATPSAGHDEKQAMEASIYFAPTIEDDGPYVPKGKRKLMADYRSQELRALVELKRAVGL